MVPGTTRTSRLERLAALLAVSLIAPLTFTACAARADIAAPSERIEDAEVLLARLAETTLRRQDLSSEARVSYYGKEGARKAKAVILARRPASLHFSVYSPSDDMLAVLASDGERFTFFERGQASCYSGRSCAENIGRFSFFPLEGHQLVDALLGGVPLIAATRTSLIWDGRSGAYRLERLGDAGVLQRIWVSHGSWLVKRMEVYRGDVLELSLAFSDIKVVSNEALAHTLDMKMPGRDVDLRVRLRDLELNTAPSDEAFEIPCPEGTSSERLLCYDEVPGAKPAPDTTRWAPLRKEKSDGK